MIEVEVRLEVKKFPDESKFKFVEEKRIVDVYYDNERYDLLKGGNFLRNRNNKKIDFKLELGDKKHFGCRETRFEFANFKPVDDLKLIFENIKVPYSNNFENFESFLKVNKLSMLAIVDKKRRNFEFEDLKICFDDVADIGKFVEAEIDLDENSIFNIEKTRTYIVEKLRKNKLVENFEPVQIGYVELYLKKHNPKAYRVGLFKDWVCPNLAIVCDLKKLVESVEVLCYNIFVVYVI